MENHSNQDEQTGGKKKRSWTRRDVGYYLAMAVLAIIFLTSAGTLIQKYLSEKDQQSAFDSLAVMLPPVSVSSEQEEITPVPEELGGTLERAEAQTAIPPLSGSERMEYYEKLRGQNGDIIGWIEIEGTQINYPVMQTIEQPNYYLHRDFERRKSSYGVPYMAEECQWWEEPKTNFLIYGHHMRNGSMFAGLAKYLEPDFYKAHPYIRCDTLLESGIYQIAAVLVIDVSQDDGTWRNLLFTSDELEFTNAWNTIRNNNPYSMGVELTREDHLLAMVTCEYTTKDGRFMVIAKKVR